MEERTDWRKFCKFPEHVNFDFGSIGKAMRTKLSPNTASECHFWLGAGIVTLELGNILACGTDHGHFTIGS